ncbi:hypothetical protein [Elizabethkingia anophelis]|uniref:hypothetical protein n=1 Tax=Elizabethkingia anophelis TaxID=1117645 RepID=UPI0016253011|nr:hypothetical protein [Elizabethkingia anophelis]
MKSYDYKELKGMNKRSILNTLGEGFNFYPSDVWIYDISRSWWGVRLQTKLDSFS